MGERLFKTEWESLIACRNHWQFMEITGSKDKKDYEPSQEWDNKCACCSFVGRGNRYISAKGCAFCPLVHFAWKQYGYGCERGDSVFMEWRKSRTVEERQFWANRMVYACNQAIENYLLNKKED